MPNYDYECRGCRKVFEIFQSIKAKPITKCPECGGRVDRLIGTGAGVLFKGSGFYQTDYRSKKYQESAKKDSSSGAPSGTAGGSDKKSPETSSGASKSSSSSKKT